ncbi:uncharacterized protein LOC123668603 [Melitaea cinxia]|uniref:uncharacterized protein LOC123668603 n=1 Tax=Melitaea cinxia TaxID=113334 RepID=UPI001E27246E|nr:uncharacterized protein LOC123668603 [Melitaea cinxia]
MQLINQQSYKIIIADEPGSLSRELAGLYIPVIQNIEGDDGDEITAKELEDATNYVKYFLERDFSDDSQNSDTESEDDSDEEYDWTPPSSPIPVTIGDFDENPIDDEELQELIAVLDKIVQNNPNLLDDPRPVIDLELYKYGSYLTGSDEFVWEFEYYIHENPTVRATD